MKLKNFNWSSGLFVTTYHALLLITLPIYFFFSGLPSVGLVLATLLLWLATGISITAGYHRLFAHKSYKTNKAVECVLLFFATLATQNSALQWSFAHRMHHRFVDSDKDPYSIKKGFWYAHVLWIIFEKSKPIDESVVPDLYKNKLVMCQYRYYTLLWVLTNALVFLGLGFAFKDFFGAFVFGVLARIFFTHHFTWFINSLAHYWGAQTYSREFSAVDNYLISLLTFGEGYHNYHHTFSSDYRNGVRWYHFDPTKWLVWTLSKLRLAQHLTKMNTYTIKRKLVQEDKKLLLDKIKERISLNKEVLEAKVHTLSERISAYLASVKEMKEEYKRAKQMRISKEKRMQLRLALRSRIKGLRVHRRAWGRLVKDILYPQPARES